MADGYALDPAELTAAGNSLRSVADLLAGRTGALRVSPDAGSSTDEIRKAFAALATGVDGVAQALRGAADGLDATVRTYSTTDTGVGSTFGAGVGP